MASVNVPYSGRYFNFQLSGYCWVIVVFTWSLLRTKNILYMFSTGFHLKKDVTSELKKHIFARINGGNFFCPFICTRYGVPAKKRSHNKSYKKAAFKNKKKNIVPSPSTYFLNLLDLRWRKLWQFRKNENQRKSKI